MGAASTFVGPHPKAHTLWDDVPAGQGPRAIALLSLEPVPFEQKGNQKVWCHSCPSQSVAGWQRSSHVTSLDRAPSL